MYKKILKQFEEFTKSYETLRERQHIIQNLNVAEIHTIVLIGKKKNININEVAKYRNISRSAASQLIKKLELKKLIRKDSTQDNAKEKLLSLTTDGKQIYDIHKQQQQYIEKQVVNIISSRSNEELEVITSFMSDVENVWNNLPWIESNNNE